MSTEFEDYDFGDWCGDDIRFLISWLDRHGPREWHSVALTWNYTYGWHPIAWICSRPQCDLATAQRVLWGNHPEHFMERILDGADDSSEPDYALISLIMARVHAGLYPTAKFDVTEAALTSDIEWYRKVKTKIAPELVPWSIPVELEVPIVGEVLDHSGYHDGIPLEIYDEFMSIDTSE